MDEIIVILRYDLVCLRRITFRHESSCGVPKTMDCLKRRRIYQLGLRGRTGKHNPCCSDFQCYGTFFVECRIQVTQIYDRTAS